MTRPAVWPLPEGLLEGRAPTGTVVAMAVAALPNITHGPAITLDLAKHMPALGAAVLTQLGVPPQIGRAHV